MYPVPEPRREVVTDRNGRKATITTQLRHSGEIRVCSFCGKDEGEVLRLIEGPGVAICDECVDVCAEIVGRARADP